MNRTPKSRSISATPKGLEAVRRKMAELKKPENEIQNKRVKKSWTPEYLSDKSFVSLSTVKRFLKREAVDESSLRSIIDALGLNWNDIVDESSSAQAINWHEVCSTMLEPQHRITSNPLMQDESAKKERKQIYVPLALVQRTKTDKRNKEGFSPDMGTRLYEPEYETQQRFEHEAFLSQILERGEGKTKGQQIAVIGEPGAGKTTLLQAIAFWVLEKGLGLPVWVSLADLGRNGTLTDIQTYICNSWLQQAIPSTKLTQEIRDDFTNQIQQGRVWLLLDGVDEISEGSASHQPLEEISRQLTGWVGRSSRVVLTCRLNIWQADRNTLETFETYRLLDFDYPQQVHQFIDNWFVEEIEKGGRLKTELDSAERVRLQDMVQTPLRLALLCNIWQSEEGNLPETKAGLYHRCVQQFYKWKQNRFPTSIKEQQELNLALGRLALRDINEGSSRFRLRESFISEELGYADDDKTPSLFYKALKLGWLNNVGIAAESPSKEKVYAFYHATFEEYFAALAVKDWDYFLNHVPKKPEQGSYRIFEPQWKEVILLWLGREDIKKEQKEEFIKALVEFEDGCNIQNQIQDWKGFYEYRAYFIAAAGIAEFKNCGLANVIVKQIVTWGFGYFNIQTQGWKRFDQQIEENARAVLVESERKKATTELVKLIRDPQFEDIRWQAVDSLGKIAKDNPTAITALVKLIRDPQFEDIGGRAAYSLGKVAKDNPTAITALVELIRGSQSEKVRIEAAYNLGKIAKDNLTAITALVKLIRDSQSEDIRWQAVDSLGKVAKDNPIAITALVELIRDSQSEKVRSQAAYSLEKIAKANPTAITALVELIRDSQSEKVRSQAAYSLGKIAKANPTAIAALVELIRDSQSEDIRWQAAYNLGEIAKDDPTAITALEKLIHDSQSEKVRIEAAYSLGKIAKDNPTAITALVELLRDFESGDIRAGAVFTLRKMSKVDTAITALEKLIHDSQSEDTRWRTADSLRELARDNPTAITALVELIRDSQSEDIRIRAVDSLGEIAKGNPTAITSLVELTRDSQSEDTHWRAAYRLGEIAKGNPTAIIALEELIHNSPFEYIRRQAAESLGKIAKDNPTAITALVGLISDSQSKKHRRRAAESLEKIAKDNPTAITALVGLISDYQSEDIRIVAADTLGKIAKDNSTTITTLVELIRDSQSEDIRIRAVHSLQNLLTESENMTAVVTALKNYLSNQAYKVIWHCTQTMTYPAFYQAWHH